MYTQQAKAILKKVMNAFIELILYDGDVESTTELLLLMPCVSVVKL